ncbi:ABC transporter substrate-binding protein [Massilia sp. X63]|uniref:ABC transporter substrate-binding protein n=1 Tax=Massilia sp. X63 TaxID=3237285 RepID=UPI0034DD36D7
MRRRTASWLACAGLLPFALPIRARAQAPVTVALTAEFGLSGSTSAQAIELGLRMALADINAASGVLGGRPLRLIARDDRSIPARAIRNFQEFQQAPDLVAIFGGKFSPVLLDLAPLARQAGIPLLAPWSSADALTDDDSTPAVTFRLALKDSWAIGAMARYLARRHAVRTIGLLAPTTAWGRSSVEALRRLSAATGAAHQVQWYSWGERTLLPHYLALRGAGADGLILVGNEGEAARMLREIAALPAAQRLPVALHGGATGGDLFAMAGPALGQVDVAVVQSFSFGDRSTPARRRVLARLAARTEGMPVERVSSAGFAQAYDLMHLLALAIDRAGSTDCKRIRIALENLPAHTGLVKHYARPFAPGRHDALSPDDIFMARFTRDGRLARLSER